MKQLMAVIIVASILLVTYVIPETNGCNGTANNERRAKQATEQMRQK